MKITKIKKMGMVAVATAMFSIPAFAAKDLVDSSGAGVMSKAGCVMTKGGTSVCGGAPSCITFSGNTITSHDHACLGGVKASDYSGAKAAAVKALLARHGM